MKKEKGEMRMIVRPVVIAPAPILISPFSFFHLTGFAGYLISSFLRNSWYSER